MVIADRRMLVLPSSLSGFSTIFFFVTSGRNLLDARVSISLSIMGRLVCLIVKGCWNPRGG